MKKSSEELQEEFLAIQHKGKMSLRLFLIFFLLLLLIYGGAQGYFMSLKYPDFYEHTYRYLWPIVLQLLWLVPVWLLWNYHLIGELFYFICLLGTLYIGKDMYLFVKDASVIELSLPYISLFCACIWRFFLIMGQIKLLHNPRIRSIWSVYDMFDDELADEEEPLVEQPQKEETPIEKKAKKRLHKNAVGMGMMLYTFIIVVLLLLLFLKIQFPEIKESIEIIERTLFENFLFTAFLWIIPIATMYLYHSSTRWLLLIAIVVEITKGVFSYENYFYVFTSGLVVPLGQVLFVIIEILRFIILIWWSIRVIRDPYSYHYWKKSK